jgi:hypothetical protein
MKLIVLATILAVLAGCARHAPQVVSASRDAITIRYHVHDGPQYNQRGGPHLTGKMATAHCAKSNRNAVLREEQQAGILTYAARYECVKG